MLAPSNGWNADDAIQIMVPASMFKKLDAVSQKHFIAQAAEGWLEKYGTTLLIFHVSRAKDAAAFATAIFAKNQAAIKAARRDDAAESSPRTDTEGGT